MKIEAAPDLLDKIRLYAEPFEGCAPPLFALFPGGAPEHAPAVFPFAPDSDRGLGILLLAASLHRPGGEAAAARILADLYRIYGNDIFKLNRLPFETLRDAVNASIAGAGDLCKGMEEAERNRIPGILRSVCDFFYRIGPLGAWLASAPDWETRAGELCNEIYWMGLRSRTRNKARLFFWLACQVPGFGARPEMKRQALDFQWPVTDTHMRFWIDIAKPPFTLRSGAGGGRTPEERLAAFAAFGRVLFPAAPWRLFLPLDSYLRRDGRGSFRCRTAQGGCRPCPLAKLCPAAGQFIPGEGS